MLPPPRRPLMTFIHHALELELGASKTWLARGRAGITAHFGIPAPHTGGIASYACVFSDLTWACRSRNVSGVFGKLRLGWFDRRASAGVLLLCHDGE